MEYLSFPLILTLGGAILAAPYLWNRSKRFLANWITTLLLEFPTGDSTDVEFIGETIRITYTHNGFKRRVYLPYHSDYEHEESVIVVINGQEIDITHPPGIPNLVTGSHLGADRVLLEGLDGERREIDLQTIPKKDS